MGSPLGPLMANVFMCHLEDKLARDGMIPSLYKRYVDDTLARMPNTVAAAEFLTTLNGLHPSLKFTMELPADNKNLFVGIETRRSKIVSRASAMSIEHLLCATVPKITFVIVLKDACPAQRNIMQL